MVIWAMISPRDARRIDRSPYLGLHCRWLCTCCILDREAHGGSLGNTPSLSMGSDEILKLGERERRVDTKTKARVRGWESI